jgi:hypothetical protein
MEKLKLRLLCIPALIIAISCASGTKTEKSGGAGKTTASTAKFDPSKVSDAQRASTMEEVRVFINSLNKVISAKNYDAWKDALSPEYFERISSAENLSLMSETPMMKAQKKILKTPKDYFDFVVVPSRADSRVDEIEFLNINKVKAYTIKGNNAERMILYDLEKTDNMWKIIN